MNVKSIKKVSSSNKLYYIFLAIFIVGYAVFFTSKLWLPKTYQDVPITKIADCVQSNDRLFTVASWTYSKEQRKMEIILEIDNYSIDNINNYLFRARTVDGPLQTRVVAEDGRFFAIHVANVNKNWAEVALTIDADEESENEFNQVKIYMNDKEIKNVANIQEEELNIYKQRAYSTKIEEYTKAAGKKRDEIKELEDSITIADSKIDEFNQKMFYQTESEKKSLEGKIDELKSKKRGYEESISILKSELEELNQKIEQQNKLLKTLKGEE